MNLYNFENYIDSKILERGCDYYDNGCVSPVEEIEENIYEAEVEGTHLYFVEVELDSKGNIIDTQCDCPYDMGGYCKHQAAVFLALRDMKRKIPDNKSSMKKEKEIDIRKILLDRSKEELVDFILDIAFENQEISQRIELNFIAENDEEGIGRSIALIRTHIKNNSDKWGFVSYRETREAVKGADLVLENAQRAFEQNKIMHAIGLALCVAHEMIVLLQDSDDSAANVSSKVSDSFTLIDEIIMKNWFIRALRICGVIFIIQICFSIVIAFFAFTNTEGCAKVLAQYLIKEDALEKSDGLVIIRGFENEKRFNYGIELYKQGYGNKMIVSGAGNENYILKYMTSDAVKKEDILIDQYADSIFENAVHVKKLVDDNHIKSFILITSPDQSKRARQVFDKVFKNSRIKIFSSSNKDSEFKPGKIMSSINAKQQLLIELVKLIDYTFKY